MVPQGNSIGEVMTEAPTRDKIIRRPDGVRQVKHHLVTQSSGHLVTYNRSKLLSNNKHTIVALMQDRPGVLNRAVSLFRRRGFNIESLAVGHSETPGVSRMTLVVEAADVEQVTKQLYRLIEVLKVSDVTNDPTVERET